MGYFEDPDNELPPIISAEDLLLSATAGSTVTIRNEYFSELNLVMGESGIASVTFHNEGPMHPMSIPLALELVGMLTQPEFFSTDEFRAMASEFEAQHGINQIEFVDEQGVDRYSISVYSDGMVKAYRFWVGNYVQRHYMTALVMTC